MFCQEVHWDCVIPDFLHKTRPAKLVFCLVKPLRLEIQFQTAILAARRSERDTQVGVERNRTGQRTLFAKVAAKIFWDESADEDEVLMPGAQTAPDSQEGALGQSHPMRFVFSMGLVFHGRQNPSQLRNAAACSGPRSPVFCRSR